MTHAAATMGYQPNSRPKDPTMGADLIITAVEIAGDGPLNFDAGRTAVDTAGLDAVRDSYWAEINEFEPDTPDRDIRDALKLAVDTLDQSYTGPWRDTASLVVDGTPVLLAGGTSSGAASETYGTLDTLQEVPEVLAAIGLRPCNTRTPEQRLYAAIGDGGADQQVDHELYALLITILERNGQVTDHTRNLLEDVLDSLGDLDVLEDLA